MAYYVNDSKGNTIAIFNHIPKTGGTFIRKCLGDLGFDTPMQGYAHSAYFMPGVFSFRFIRSPLSWYPSMFAYRQSTGWPARPVYYGNAVVANLWQPGFRAGTLEQFVQNVSYYYPDGYLRRVYAVGGASTYTGRQEQLNQDFVTAMSLLGVSVPPGFFTGRKRDNAGVGKPGLTKNLHDFLAEYEAAVFTTYRYLSP